MKSFREYLREQAALGCFNIGRENMPQLDDIEKFKDYLNEIGVDYKDEKVMLNKIDPTQIEFNQEKVDNMPLSTKSIVISNDYKVLDGHHRFFKHQQTEKHTIKALKVDQPINQLLETAYNFLK